MWSAGYNSLQQYISFYVKHVWVAELHGDHKCRFIKVFQHTFSTPLERESFPQMFFTAVPTSPTFPGGLVAPQDFFARFCPHGMFFAFSPSAGVLTAWKQIEQSRKCKFWNPAVIVIEVVISRTPPPPPTPGLHPHPVDIPSTRCCFLVKNEPKTTHASHKQALFCRSAMFSFRLSLFISLTAWTSYSPTHWPGMCTTVFHCYLCRTLYIQIYLQACGGEKKKWR